MERRELELTIGELVLDGLGDDPTQEELPAMIEEALLRLLFFNEIPLEAIDTKNLDLDLGDLDLEMDAEVETQAVAEAIAAEIFKALIANLEDAAWDAAI